MLEKFVKILQQKSEAKYFLVILLLTIALSISGFASIYVGLALLVGLIPAVIGLSIFENKINYDSKQTIIHTSALVCSLFFALFMLKELQNALSVYSLVFAVITFASILLFNHLKHIASSVVPVLLVYIFLLLFEQEEPATLPAVIVTVFTLVFTALKLYDHHHANGDKNSVKQIKGSAKLEFVEQIDTLKIENTSLQDNIKKLEIDLSAAEMAKMEFLATMSHEIRTPLNGIIPLLDILLDSELSDFQKDYLSTAHVSAIQMQKLIDDLLDYSKVEAGKLSVETRGLKVPKLLSAVKTSYQQVAEKKNISIEINTHGNVSPLLRGDPTRLRQVLSNLLSNAIKFSSMGTIKVSAKKIKDYPNKEIIRFEVKDQGIGLDKETSDSIFLPFTQEDASSTRKFGGTGLGLAISNKIVELMNGTMGVDSIKGKGSTFYFDLPLLKSVGETEVGTTSNSDFQAILVNTNPLLFNKVEKELKEQEITTQKALGITQAYEIYSSIVRNSKDKKHILIFVDFETAGKQARNICERLEKDDALENAFACILTDNKHLAGIPKRSNIKLISKESSIGELINRIEVMKASTEVQEDENQEGGELNHKKEGRHVNISEQDVENLIPEILLVEDNEINLKVAEKLIQYIGYPFDFAMNGQEALEKVKQNRYRMILMDCQMPIMDGYRCTTKIREYEAATGLNHTPILAMTANAMMGDREKCLDAGMDDYMSKPLNRFMLEKTLKKWDPLREAGGLESGGGKPIEKQKNDMDKTSTPETHENKEANQRAPISLATKKKVEINQKWLSTKSLEEMEEIMGDETTQLLEMFKQETPTILADIRDGLKGRKLTEVQKKAHMLKSTSANIGANGLSFFSRKLELSATEKRPIGELVATYKKISKSYLLTKNEIDKYIESV